VIVYYVMARRKFPKRSRQRAKFYEIQQSFRQHARSLKQCQYNSKIENTSDRQENSELMFESQHANLLHNNELSPEIASKSPRVKLEVDIYGNDAKMGNNVNVQATERSKLESNFSTCDFKLNAGSTDSFPSLENYPKHDVTTLIIDNTLDLRDTLSSRDTSLFLNKTADEHESAASASGIKFYQASSQSAMSRSNFKSHLLRDNASTYINEISRSANSDRKPKMNEQFPDERSDQQEETDNCRLVDKTLSMNDDLACEMNNYLDQRTSAIIGHSILRPIAILHGQCLPESTRSARLCKSGNQSRSADDVRLLSDEFQLVGASTCKTVDKHDKLRDNFDKKSRNILNDNRRFETIGKRLIMNWREFWRIFARLNKRIENKKDAERDTVPLLSKWFTDDPKFSYVSISTSSSFHTPPLSQRHANNRNLADCDNTNSQFSFAQSNEQGLEKTEHTIRNSRFIASCNRGSSSAKRCQTILTLENEYRETERQSSMCHANVPFALSGKKRKSKKSSFPLDQSISNETRQNSHSLESTSTSDLDQFALTDCDSLQEVMSWLLI